LGIATNWSTYLNSNIELLILFSLSVSVVGIVEEFVFRGIIFPLFIRSSKTTDRPILISAVLSSLMFGIVHFFNIFSQPENIIGITSQVFFATSIGVFFCGLMVRTGNILIPIIIHALINFSFGAGELKQSMEYITDVENVSGVNWSSIVPTTMFFSFIFIGGIYMILKTDKENILNTLIKE
jgi:membrane protease YdiL (CAAX protease family)